MKPGEIRKNTILGAFVLAGAVLFILAVFLVGNNETLFHRTFMLYAQFQNAGGLQKGNNVWFNGVKVGTVSAVEILDDSTVQAAIRVREEYKPFIKKDVIASLDRDGLMGNRILVLQNRESQLDVRENQIIASKSGDETGELLALLKESGINILAITESIKEITGDIESGQGLIGELVTNEMWKSQFGSIVAQMEAASHNTALVSGDLSGLVEALKQNKTGIISTLITDTTFSKVYSHSLANIEMTSENAARITGNFKEVVDQMGKKENAIGVILTDTAFANDLKRALELLNEDLKAAQHSFLLRGYFRKKERKENKK